MPPRPSDRIVRLAEWPFQKIGDELIVVVPKDRLMHRIEGIGVRIWDLLAEPRTVRRLLDLLQEEYEVAPERLEKDVLEFLDALKEKGLVKVG